MTAAADQVSVKKRLGVPLIDGIEKVTGKARYTADLDHADALVGHIFRSPVGHADIIRLDVSKARALAGVVAVVTGDDCPHTYGVLPIAMNEYPLARGRVRYRGEPVAAVAAIDAETAERALGLIEFEVKELPAYYTSETARAPGAVLLHDNKPGNIERDVHHEFGDVRARFCRRRSGARGTIQLRRDQPRADRAAREPFRIRSGDRASHDADRVAGRLLPAPDARAMPGNGFLAHPRDQAVHRRRFRRARRDA